MDDRERQIDDAVWSALQRLDSIGAVTDFQYCLNHVLEFGERSLVVKRVRQAWQDQH